VVEQKVAVNANAQRAADLEERKPRNLDLERESRGIVLVDDELGHHFVDRALQPPSWLVLISRTPRDGTADPRGLTGSNVKTLTRLGPPEAPWTVAVPETAVLSTVATKAQSTTAWTKNTL
jgi:hypothetical protein